MNEASVIICVLAIIFTAVTGVVSYRRGRLNGSSEQQSEHKKRLRVLQEGVVSKERRIHAMQARIRGAGDTEKVNIRRREILEEKLRQKGREISLLSEASLFLTNGDFQKTCNLLAYRVSILPDVKFARLYTLNEDGTTLKLVSAYNISEKYLEMIKEDFEFPVGNIPAGTAVVNRVPFVVDDVQSDDYFSQWRQITALYDYRSYAAVPLMRTDRIVDVLEVFFEKENIFSKDFVEIMNIITNVGALAIENALFTEKMHKLSIIDELTSAYNRRFLMSTFDVEMKRAARHAHAISYIMFDLDNFKAINDNLGHLKGDEVLRSVAMIMKENTRTTDYVCRYGGDEFAILLPETSRHEALMVIEKIKAATMPLWTSLLPGTGLSTGFSVYPEDGNTTEELIRRADDLVYEEKQARKTQHFRGATPSFLS